MSKKTKILSLIVLCTLFVALISLNISLALFSDRYENSGIIQFKQHKLDISVKNNEEITLSKEELTINSTSTRTINITNPANSTSCVFRLWLEFYVDNSLDSNYLSLSLPENQFTKSEDNKYYYNRILASNSSVNDLVLTFSVNGELDAQDYQGKKYEMKIYIESIQSTKIAVLEWNADNYPVEWYNLVENYLA